MTMIITLQLPQILVQSHLNWEDVGQSWFRCIRIGRGNCAGIDWFRFLSFILSFNYNGKHWNKKWLGCVESVMTFSGLVFTLKECRLVRLKSCISALLILHCSLHFELEIAELYQKEMDEVTISSVVAPQNKACGLCDKLNFFSCHRKCWCRRAFLVIVLLFHLRSCWLMVPWKLCHFCTNLCQKVPIAMLLFGFK